jgi:excisionase family DNA binding protein
MSDVKPFGQNQPKSAVEPPGRRFAVKSADEGEKLLTPAEVAAMFRVDPKTVTRWAKAGKLSSIRTLGGHRRYRESEIRGLLQDSTTGMASSEE